MKIFFPFKNLLNNHYLKNFLTLFSGSVVGQLIVFISIPFLTRVFSQEAFGVYALFTSSILLLKPLTTLNYELAIILPKRDKDAINIFAFNILIIFSFSIISLCIILVFHKNIISFLNIERLAYFIYFIPLSVFLIASISALENWNIRFKTYKNVSLGVVSKSATLSFSQLLTGFSNFKYIGLIPGLIIGQLINLLILTKLTLNNIASLYKYVSFKRMLFLASKYRDIPLFNTLLTFTNTFSGELPILLVTRFYGLSPAGILSLSLKVSKLPPGLVGQSVSQIFFNEASKIYNTGQNLFELVKRTYFGLFFTALAIFIPLFIVSFYLYYIFGEGWSDVGIYVRILIPLLFLSFLNSSVSSIITILKKQKIVLIFDIINLPLRFIALYVGFHFYESMYVSIALFSIVGIIFNLTLLGYFLHISKNSKVISY